MSLTSKIFYTAHRILERMPGIYAHDSLITTHYAPLLGTSGRAPWIEHVIWWAARTAIRNVPKGAVVECGVYRGLMARMLLIESGRVPIWLFDTWSGPDQRFDSAKGATHCGSVEWEGIYQSVCSMFANYPTVHIVRGPINDTLPVNKPSLVAFASIDMNAAEPERFAMETLWPVMGRGAVMVHDDYGHRGFEAQREMVNNFCRERDVMPLILPTGQAVIVKH